jgi:hypothetical protein
VNRHQRGELGIFTHVSSVADRQTKNL